MEEAQSPVESPSLSAPGNGEGPAFEMKFLLDEPLARVVEECVRDKLPLDPHGDAHLEGAYLVRDSRRNAFDAVVAEIQAEASSAGLEARLTGPWPPFSFVTEELR